MQSLNVTLVLYFIAQSPICINCCVQGDSLVVLDVPCLVEFSKPKANEAGSQGHDWVCPKVNCFDLSLSLSQHTHTHTHTHTRMYMHAY